MDPRTTERARSAAVDPRTSLALWLRAGRTQRKLSLDDIARITKIQSRILEKLESGQADGLPAEVFVRGFVRSFAKCVGLDEAEALERLGEITSAPAAARAFVETMVPMVPVATKRVPVPPIEPIPSVPEISPSDVDSIEIAIELPAETVEVAAEPTEPAKKKRTRKSRGSTTATPRTRQKKLKPETELAVAAEAAIVVVELGPETDSTPLPVPVENLVLAVGSEPISTFDDPTQVWQPTMPPIATTPSVPWRRPAFSTTTYTVPSLVIDDGDPDLAERERDDREAAKGPHRVSFLPPILLDREDKSARQGGLTLAVIILLIAATLTLSYLMRRPSASGDGVTLAPISSASQLA